jgi:hypothetical protein
MLHLQSPVAPLLLPSKAPISVCQSWSLMLRSRSGHTHGYLQVIPSCQPPTYSTLACTCRSVFRYRILGTFCRLIQPRCRNFHFNFPVGHGPHAPLGRSSLNPVTLCVLVFMSSVVPTTYSLTWLCLSIVLSWHWNLFASCWIPRDSDAVPLFVDRY